MEDGSTPLLQCFDAEIEAITSREFKCCGAVGMCTSLNRKSQSVADTEIGIGGTNAWKLGGLHPHSTVGIFFEIVNTNAQQVAADQRQAYLQLRTKVCVCVCAVRACVWRYLENKTRLQDSRSSL